MACAVEILLVCLLVFLLGRLFWGRVSDPPCGRSAVPLIDGRGLPIRDFKWDELRLGDVAGMEELYPTRIGKVFSPSGGVAPKINVVKYMKELCLRSHPPRASASPTPPSATKTASGALRLGMMRNPACSRSAISRCCLTATSPRCTVWSVAVAACGDYVV